MPPYDASERSTVDAATQTQPATWTFKSTLYRCWMGTVNSSPLAFVSLVAAVVLNSPAFHVPLVVTCPLVLLVVGLCERQQTPQASPGWFAFWTHAPWTLILSLALSFLARYIDPALSLTIDFFLAGSRRATSFEASSLESGSISGGKGVPGSGISITTGHFEGDAGAGVGRAGAGGAHGGGALAALGSVTLDPEEAYTLVLLVTCAWAYRLYQLRLNNPAAKLGDVNAELFGGIADLMLALPRAFWRQLRGSSAEPLPPSTPSASPSTSSSAASSVPPPAESHIVHIWTSSSSSDPGSNGTRLTPETKLEKPKQSCPSFFSVSTPPDPQVTPALDLPPTSSTATELRIVRSPLPPSPSSPADSYRSPSSSSATLASPGSIASYEQLPAYARPSSPPPPYDFAVPSPPHSPCIPH